MLHPSLVRLACIPPPRLSSLLKKDTLVALLDGTADSAPSQPVAAESVAQLPVSLKRFRNLCQYPKLIDKILAAIDPHKFTPGVLKDDLWKDGAKLGLSTCTSSKLQSLICRVFGVWTHVSCRWRL